MRKLITRIATICILSITLIGCGDPHIGKYANKNKESEYLELKDNNTFFLKESGLSVHGKYTLENDELTLIFEGDLLGGSAVKANLDDKTINDNDGKTWVKQ